MRDGGDSQDGQRRAEGLRADMPGLMGWRGLLARDGIFRDGTAAERAAQTLRVSGG